MTWAAPRTWVSGEIVRARYFNQDVTAAMQAAVGQHAYVIAGEATASTVYVDLTTIGPTVSVQTLTSAIGFWKISCGGAVNNYAIASVAISGATTLAAGDDWQCGGTQTRANNESDTRSTMMQFLSLTPGMNSFTMKYRVEAGTGATFSYRSLLILPVGN